MVKPVKKKQKRIKEIKISPKELKEEKMSKEKVENEKIPEEKSEDEKIKFLEFLSPSTESVKTIAGKKPKLSPPLEQNEEILSISPSEESKKEEKNYFTRSKRDYELISPNIEKKQDISTKSFQPSRVDFREVGRDITMQPREFFSPNEDMIRMNSSRKVQEERDYAIERVDFSEVGREKRYKLMK